MSQESVLLIEEHGHVERWTLNRPHALNAFNKPLLLVTNKFYCYS